MNDQDTKQVRGRHRAAGIGQEADDYDRVEQRGYEEGDPDVAGGVENRAPTQGCQTKPDCDRNRKNRCGTHQIEWYKGLREDGHGNYERCPSREGLRTVSNLHDAYRFAGQGEDCRVQ